MNRRINELAKQCSYTTRFSYEGQGGGYDMYHFDKEKFAELIVRECVEVGAQAFLKDNRIVPVFPASQIKQHFGVE